MRLRGLVNLKLKYRMNQPPTSYLSFYVVNLKCEGVLTEGACSSLLHQKGNSIWGFKNMRRHLAQKEMARSCSSWLTWSDTLFFLLYLLLTQRQTKISFWILLPFGRSLFIFTKQKKKSSNAAVPNAALWEFQCQRCFLFNKRNVIQLCYMSFFFRVLPCYLIL